MTCSVCEREADRGSLCRAHYEQKRRRVAAGRSVHFSPVRTSPGEAGDRIQLRPTRELRAAIERAARADGEPVNAWVLGTLARVLGVKT